MKFSIQLLTFLLLGTMLSAQPGGEVKEKDMEKVEAQRVAFLTSELELTPEESAAFWPVYNIHTEKMRALKPSDKRAKKQLKEEMSDDEANQAIEKMLEANAQKLEYNRKLVSDLRGIISPQKILKLHFLENRFKRKLLGELGKRKRGQRREGR